MTFSIRPLLPLIASGLLAVVTFSGCQSSVSEGPTSTPPAGASASRAPIMGKEPAPAPIAQKETAPGQSSLSHPAPDQRVDKP